MNAERTMPLLGLLVLLIGSSAPGQAPAPSSGQPPAAPAGLRKLAGDDETRAKHLDEQIDKATEEDRWGEALAKAEELSALRVRVQGAKHFEAVDAEWRVKRLRRVAALPKDDRAAFLSAIDLNEQAEALNSQGEYAQAQPLFEQALEINRRLLSNDHPDTALSYNNLAANLNAQGNYAAAQPLYEKALVIRRRLLSDDHPDTAQSCNNVAANLNAQGKYAQAQPLFEEALAIRRRLLTDDHPDTATSYNNVAVNLDDQGHYAAAQPLLEKALEIRRRLLTDDHPDTAAGDNNLAHNLEGQGKYAQAQPLLEKALEIRRRLLTDDHPLTAQGYNNLAYNLNAQGQYAQAQPLFEKALAINRRLLSDDHPDTATGYNNLAHNLEGQGKYALAQPLYEKALEIKRRLLSDDHPDTALSYNNLAANLNAQGKYAAAQPLYEKALVIRRRLLSDDHPDTAQSYNNVAANLNAQGRYAEARDQWIHAARSFEATRLSAAFTGLERATATAKADPLVALAAVLARLGQPAEAWQRLEEHLGRGLLDELATRKDQQLTLQQRSEIQQRVAELERLDRLFEAPMTQLDQAERRTRLEQLRQQRDRAQIALGELQVQLAAQYGPWAGRVATLTEIQAALPAEDALMAWVDLKPTGPKAADPGGEHWAVVIRARGTPAWIRLPGTGPQQQWTEDDTKLAAAVRQALTHRPGPKAPPVQPLIRRLRAQRLTPCSPPCIPRPTACRRRGG
jgi:tetratricopeptide (TPR) repeat protein